MGAGGRAWVDETCTVLLTDIEDSTWLWEHHPDDMEIVVRITTQLVGVAVRRARGMVVQIDG